MGEGVDEAQLFDRPLGQDERIEIRMAHGTVEAVDGKGDGQPIVDQLADAGGAIGIEIDRRLDLQAKGTMLPFAVLDPQGRVLGMTTYMNIDAPNRRVEIGSTCYRASAQRTPLNTECKHMLLTHAFEKLNCIAVEFRTHVLNSQSRKAIERLGAKLDGILRRHLIQPNGSIRDTAVYSITAAEWPMVKAHLDWQLAKPR